MSNVENDKREITAAARDTDAVKLRVAGATFQQIADQLGYVDKSHASQAVKRCLKKAAREATQEMFELELQRLEDLQVTYWVQARAGDKKAAELCLKIIDRRCKLLGLDAAIKIDHDLHVYSTREEMEAELVRILNVGNNETTDQPTT